MKLGAIWISYINDIDGKRYRTREQNINLDRSLLDDIRGQDEKRFIFLMTDRRYLPAISAVKSFWNPTPTPRKNN